MVFVGWDRGGEECEGGFFVNEGGGVRIVLWVGLRVGRESGFTRARIVDSGLACCMQFLVTHSSCVGGRLSPCMACMGSVPICRGQKDWSDATARNSRCMIFMLSLYRDIV